MISSVSVAPLAGAWIEISSYSAGHIINIVAPLAGAWIEIFPLVFARHIIESLPSRERGLKFEEYSRKGGRIAVAPLAGAWIEILLFACDCGEVASRSPRGSVD